MKSRFLEVLASLILMLPVQLVGQEGQPKHHHYKLIEPATFGGPGSRINGFIYSGFSSVQDLNSTGTLIGWADTSTPDPYGPNFCFTTTCYVAHAFQLQNGVVTDLGVLSGGLSSATSWISANGLIAGASQNGETDPLFPGFPENRAVLWRNGKIINLGTLPEGGYESGAQAVNSSGQVVGWALNTIPDPYSMASLSTLYNYYEPFSYPSQMRAFLWQDGVMRDLGTLGTGTDAFAMAINEAGQVVGISYTDSTANQVTTPCASGPIPTQDPFLWENGKMIDLGTLGGTCGFPSWINNYGGVVGYSDLAGDQTFHAFLWTRWTGIQDLGTLGGSYALASMINDLGDVVGSSTLEGDNQSHAFLWNGKMHDLGSLDGSNCADAFSVNAQQQVVGNSGPDCTSAFLWENGGPMVDLSTLVSPNPGFASLGVIIINDRGEIGGQGNDASGFAHPVLLIPCDENHPDIEGCDYSLVESAAPAEVRTSTVNPAAVSGAGQHKSSLAETVARNRQRPQNPHLAPEFFVNNSPATRTPEH
jgi:probable HAF family extracellular repeat protein